MSNLHFRIDVDESAREQPYERVLSSLRLEFGETLRDAEAVLKHWHDTGEVPVAV